MRPLGTEVIITSPRMFVKGKIVKIHGSRMKAPAFGAKEGNFAEGKVIRGKAADGSGRIEDSDFATSEDSAPVWKRACGLLKILRIFRAQT